MRCRLFRIIFRLNGSAYPFYSICAKNRVFQLFFTGCNKMYDFAFKRPAAMKYADEQISKDSPFKHGKSIFCNNAMFLRNRNLIFYLFHWCYEEIEAADYLQKGVRNDFIPNPFRVFCLYLFNVIVTN